MSGNEAQGFFPRASEGGGAGVYRPARGLHRADVWYVVQVAGFLWRAIKSWRGLRGETPWFTTSPADLVRQHVRLTLQPFDAPGASEVEKILAHIDCDELLLFSTDFPHWHFEGKDAVPAGIPASLLQKIAVDNPLATYPRLKETLS